MVTYFIAAYQGDVPWFPVMITDTAKEYPEYIIFRIGMLFPLFMWMIQVFVIFMWLNQEKRSLGLLFDFPFYINYLPWIGLASYSITIATIDNCEMN